MTRKELNQELLKIYYQFLDVFSKFDEEKLNEPEIQEKLNEILDKIEEIKKEIET